MSPYLRPDRNDDLPAVDRVDRITPKELLQKYVLGDRPVVLTGAVADWPAVGKWTPEFFAERYGDRALEVDGRSITIAEQMRNIRRSTPADPAPYPYNLDIRAEFPELMADLHPEVHFGGRDRFSNLGMPGFLRDGILVHEVFFGGNGSAFPWLHYDLLALHTQITQVHGDKEFFLYPPDQGDLLYPRPDNPRISQVSDIFVPDLGRFPRFAESRPLHAYVREGETLFFPRGWWHTTVIHGPSISYGHSVLNATNWNAFLREKRAWWAQRNAVLAWPAFIAGHLIGGALALTEGPPRPFPDRPAAAQREVPARRERTAA